MADKAKEEASPKPEDTPEQRAERIPGFYRNTVEANARLAYAAKMFNLVSPATMVGKIPEGHAVAFSMTTVDVRDVKVGGETFEAEGGGGLSIMKSALLRIAAGAGIVWEDSRLTPNDPHNDHPDYCNWEVKAVVQDFDQTYREVIVHKRNDWRKGAAQREGKSDKFIKQERIFIQEKAESKAMNRAIRILGALRPSYTLEQLKKPFVMVKLVWTGESDDPELRRTFAMMGAARTLGGRGAAARLFGQEPNFQLPQATPPPQMLGAPARRHAVIDADEEEPTPAPRARAQAPEPPPTPRPAAPAGSAGNDTTVVKFGKNKGTPIAELSEESYVWYLEALEASIDDPERERFRDDNLLHLAAVKAARRGATAEGKY